MSKDLRGTRLLATDWDSRWQRELSATGFYGIASDGSAIVHVGLADLRERGGAVPVTRVKANGDTVFVQRVPYVGTPMPTRYVDSVLAKGVGIDLNIHKLPQSKIPPVFAPANGVFVQSNGFTWLTMLASQTSSYVIVLNVSGTPIAQFAVPPRSYLLAATDEHVWFTVRDGDDLQSVVRYRIRCGGKVCR